MKNWFALFPLLFIVSSSLFAQTEINLKAKAADRFRAYSPSGNNERLDEGTEFDIVGYQILAGSNQINYRILLDDEPYITSSRNILETVEVDYGDASLKDLWTFHYINSEALIQVAKHGRDPELRTEVEQEYLELENSLEMYDDPFLLDYLNQMLMRVFPGEIPERQAANLEVKIFNGSEPWAFAFSNGKIYLSTGLLATLNSEAELMGILATEVAHIYLDHSVTNYRMQEIREARAKFWTGLLTVAALAAETAVAVDAANSGNYDLLDYQFFGVFTESVFLLSNTVAYAILERLGMEYTQEQTVEADQVARRVLQWHGEDDSALISALSRISEYYQSTREYALGDGHTPFPQLQHRISQSAKDDSEEQLATDFEYLRRFATVISMSAWQEYREGELDIAQRLIDRLVDSGLANVDDHVLRSVLLRRTSLDKVDAQRALVWLEEAEQSAKSVPLELHLERAVLHQRLGNIEEARNALVRYREDLLKVEPLQEKRLRWVEQMLERL